MSEKDINHTYKMVNTFLDVSEDAYRSFPDRRYRLT